MSAPPPARTTVDGGDAAGARDAAALPVATRDMIEHTDELIERAKRSAELEGVLATLEGSAVPEGSFLHDSLYVLRYTEGSVCLACANPDARFFYRWTDGGLREIAIRERSGLTSRPQTTDPARTAAALETAERVELVPVAATPFGDPR